MTRAFQIIIAILFGVVVAVFVTNLAYAVLRGVLAHDWSIIEALSGDDYAAAFRQARAEAGGATGRLIIGVASLFGVLAGAAPAIMLTKGRDERGAHFMTLSELRHANFLTANTMLLGRFGGMSLSRRRRIRNRKTGEVDFVDRRRLIGGRYLHAPYFGHVFVSGPTRSGKGAAIIIPNALEFRGSMVILDIRGETYENTAAYRSRYSKIYKFAPAQQRSHGYNPLDFIRAAPGFRESDIMNCASGLVAAASLREEYWIKDARELVAGVISYVLESPEISKKSISSVMGPP